MPVKINGLPAHVLLVHAVVVLVPLACLALVLHTCWPAARSRLGVVTPLLALVSLVLVPVTTHAGNYLKAHQHVGPAIEAKVIRHQALGNQLIYYVVPLFVLTVVAWLVGRYLDGASVPGLVSAERGVRAVPTSANVVLAVVSLGLAVATVVQLYRIGDAGAHAVWDGTLH